MAHPEPEEDPVTDDDLVALAVGAAKVNGCTCTPDADLTRDTESENLVYVNVRHDSVCRLLLRLAARAN